MGLFISLSSFLYLFISLSIYYFVMPSFFPYLLRIATSDKEREGIYQNAVKRVDDYCI